MFKNQRTSRLLGFIAGIVIIAALFSYQLPYYIHKPGHADSLTGVIEVEGATESEGDMHLVTIQSGRATPFQYLLASLRDYEDIVPVEDVLLEGMTDQQYREMQLMMMESSQEASTVVAYEAAGKDIDISYNGVYVVSVVDGMPADGVLQSADEIVEIDGQQINEADDLIDYVSSKQAGDTISLTVNREEETLHKEITLESLEELDGSVGMGIQLVTNRKVTVSPEVTFSSGGIGGPSAGLMFSLDIYNQLTDEDLTHGLQVVGTGEIDYQGNVGRIGGIDKKVVAADRDGCDIFFAPNENGREDSNYQIAKQTAEDIGTDMKIVPVDTFSDALEYLENVQG
ncbi:SepM family pheromone-processing serine protease [Gracilibacillus sp. S3-1-1]|uniref:SepM family pheromone-processing serine protease n=1 Tax=Gracilibacillus pellucidus TaxID=3095368 RepID=A0ACC6M1V1_9BACI|nr:SepM family pheromone-processing serine protease [Gracilibacillus sp. S3-1-1]MDX8044914.1 SepM family pheromone-processing serine protease [Gracilibacillus sp. S3-1-1]